MMRVYASSRRPYTFSRLAPIAAVLVAGSSAFFAPRAASAQSIEVLRPVANAIVREKVEIKVSPRDVPPDGYVSISIDGDVVIAKILPEAGQPVFVWDTKAPYYTPDEPKKYVSDGTHELTVTIYSSGNHLVGSATIPVRVANKISVSPQGAMLKYKWQLDQTINYHRKVVITEVSDATSSPEAATPVAAPAANPYNPYGGGYPGAGRYPGVPGGYGGGYPGAARGGYPGAPGPMGYPGARGPGAGGPDAGFPGGGGARPFGGFGPGGPEGIGGRVGGDYPLDEADIHFERTVEDATAPEYLIRDKVDGSGIVSSNGSSQFVKAAYNIKSKYRTVNDFGEVLSEMPPLSQGDHFAFPIPVLPGRRVNVGDSWQTPIDVSLDWMGSDPLTVTGEARLEDFEWQDGYPVAKIHESFSGPTKFPKDRKSRYSDAPVDNLSVDQTVYFAYNAGRLIRVEANDDITVQLTQQQEEALDPFTGHTGGYGQAASFPGMSGIPGGIPGVPGGGIGAFPGARGPMGGPGGFPGAGAGEESGALGGEIGEARAPVHLKIVETTDLDPMKQ